MINRADTASLKIPLSGFVGLAITLCVMGCALLSDVHDETFKTYEDALAEGVIGKSRVLPAYIPQSATDIRVCFDTDTQETWARFRFAKGDFSLLVRHSEEISPVDVTYPHRGTARRVRWWPKDLRGPSPGSGTHYRFYRCDLDTAISDWPQTAFIAVGDDTTRAWFWRRSPAYHYYHLES